MSTIYATRGRAREYAPWATTIFSGCVHGCPYCFNVTHEDLGKPAEEFFHDVKLRLKIHLVSRHLQKFRARAQFDPTHRVCLSFSSDPYPPLVIEQGLTQEVLRRFQHEAVPFEILTKAPDLALRDLDFYDPWTDRLATTVTGLSDSYRDRWETYVELNGAERLDQLDLAAAKGIPTWVSLEPVINPDAAIAVLEKLQDHAIDHVKIGKANHIRGMEDVDWSAFALRMCGALADLGRPYYVKKSLRGYLPRSFDPDTLREAASWS